MQHIISSSPIRFIASLLFAFATASCFAEQTNSLYEFREQHDPNGIGKFYMGREIAHVMGHEGAGWLERPEREKEERTDLALAALKIKPGQSVADIGAGTGYYTRRLAKLVGTNGIVFANEIQQEMLDDLMKNASAENIRNIKPVLGTITDPKLPARSVDLILMVDVYHEFDHPHEMIEAMIPALKSGGRIAFVEFRAEDPAVAIKPVHKMSEAQVRKEMSTHKLQWDETNKTLPQQHVILFKKK